MGSKKHKMKDGGERKREKAYKRARKGFGLKKSSWNNNFALHFSRIFNPVSTGTTCSASTGISS